jgi:hypothetical protein
MTLTLGEVAVGLLIAAYGVYLFQALRVRELALQAARRSCHRDGLQLLDETVSIRRISLSRDVRGSWRIWRQYHFEYSADGVERERGHVIMLGPQLEALVMSDRTLH